jgi:hypothetical protein
MDVPDEVVKAVRAQASFDLFPVTQNENYSGQILKAKILQFDASATLTLTRLDQPFLAICTRQILLRAPDVRAAITRDMAASPPPNVLGISGAPGANGSNGANGVDGTPGLPGGAGNDASASDDLSLHRVDSSAS